MGFKRMAKMESTEPSVDEVGKGMKKGGKAKMADGGVPMGAAPAGALPAVAEQVRRRRPMTAMEASAARPRGASLMRPAAMSRPAPAIPAQAMGRVKNGGAMKKVEKEIRNEKEELHRVDKRLNRHEEMAASKAHKGLKTGGVINGQGGYKKGGVAKYATGGVVKGGPAGFKDGGHCAMKSGGDVGFKAMKKGGCW
jgi:hypothetical protein